MKTISVLAVLLLALTAPALAGNCGNTFFPAIPNSSKTFAIQGAGKTYTVSVVNASASGFTLRYEFASPVRILESPYTCTADGLTSISPGAGAGSGPDATTTTQVTKSSGLVIPVADR